MSKKSSDEAAIKHIHRLLRPRLRPWRWKRVRSSEDLVTNVMSSYQRRLPRPRAIAKSREKSLRLFWKHLRRDYKRAFQMSTASIQASTESVLQILPVLAHSEHRIEEVGAAFQLQHAQAVRAAWESMELIQRGYGHGALAHSRTVLELSIAVEALANAAQSSPEAEVAKRFFDHEELVRARQALEHDTFADLLGHERDDPENQRAATEIVERYRSRLGSAGMREFQKDWGWLGGLGDNPSPNFREVARYVGREGWYADYRYASNMTHGGSRGAVLNRIEYRGDKLPSYGPSNVFLIDPAQTTLMRLMAVAGTIVGYAIEHAKSDDDDSDGAEEGVVDRRLRQMQALTFLEYGERVTKRAIDEYFFVSAHIEHMERLRDASPIRRLAAWTVHRYRATASW